MIYFLYILAPYTTEDYKIVQIILVFLSLHIFSTFEEVASNTFFLLAFLDFLLVVFGNL